MIDILLRAWTQFDGLGWFLVLLVPLLVFQRALHREIQAVLLFITRRQDISLMLFALLFLPGVFLHETSHFLIARLLGVRTGRFSLIPRALPNGQLQLGFVETSETDFGRDSAIGAAPLLAGGIFIGLVARYQFEILGAQAAALVGDFPAYLQSLAQLPHQPDFWLWFYLVFVVSSTMFPSASDRRSWLPVIIIAVSLIVVGILTGVGPSLFQQVRPGLNQVFLLMAGICAISLAVHGIMLVPLWLLRKLLSRVMGYEVV